MIIRLITRLYQWGSVMKKLLAKEYKSRPSISWFRTVSFWSRGFLSSSQVIYDLDNSKYFGMYLTDYQENWKSKAINKRVEFLDNKLLFQSYIKDIISTGSEVLGIIYPSGNWIGFSKDLPKLNEECLTRYLKARGSLIMKPLDGASGIGVIRLDYSEGGWLVNHKQVMGWPELLGLLGSNELYLVTTLIKQNGYAHLIYPYSVNTVRVLTMWDHELNQPFIAATAHRFGNKDSGPVDNCAMGSFTVQIDKITGQLGKATKTIGESTEPVWYSKHPDTGSDIEGVQVPNWEIVRTRALQLAKRFPFCPLVGWDFVVNPMEVFVIEGNDGPDIKLHQVHQPLLLDDRVRKFYAFHNVIS